MFIAKKKINGKDYFYIQKSFRDEKSGKVKSKSIAYGGKTREEAEKKLVLLKDHEGKNNLSLDKLSIENNINKDKGGIFMMVEKGKELELNNYEKLKSIDELAQFCKAKGFVFRSSDIYGGLAGFWDYGPLGIELFNNIKQDWWHFFVRKRDNMVGIEASVISHPRTWKASGHLASFSDMAVVCKKCGKATKIDKSEVGKVNCECGGDYDVKGEFNLMFKTSIGALNPSDAYLRGETAQGMFLDFKNIVLTSRLQLPFGIAQIGRCFRNEIAPRDFMFRSREFHIGEFEFFIHPDEKECNLLDEEHKEIEFMFLDEESQKNGTNELKRVSMRELLNRNRLDQWHAYWLGEQIIWFRSIGLDEFKIREHTKDELSHYSSATFDIDYLFPFGSLEMAGNANRGQYDLTQHQNESKESMEIFDENSKSKIIPRVIEPTFGMERVFMAVLTKAYNYDKEKDYTVLKIPAKLAPVKAAVFPIIKSEDYERIAQEIIEDLRKEWKVNYDKSGSIGRRYARNDEIGTPMCITVDEETLRDKSVTIRDRDTTKQVRVKISDLKNVVRKVIDGENLLLLGKIVSTRMK